MQKMQQTQGTPTADRGPFASLTARIAAIGFLLIAGYFLLTEHTAHVVGWLQVILFLALCGGMHLFMHHGSGDGEMRHSTAPETPKDEPHV